MKNVLSYEEYSDTQGKKLNKRLKYFKSIKNFEQEKAEQQERANHLEEIGKRGTISHQIQEEPLNVPKNE